MQQYDEVVTSSGISKVSTVKEWEQLVLLHIYSQREEEGGRKEEREGGRKKEREGERKGGRGKEGGKNGEEDKDMNHGMDVQVSLMCM